MAVLGILLWIVVIIIFLLNREKGRQKQLSFSKERENVLRNFKLELLDYAKNAGKIGKQYIVDAESEGGNWHFNYYKLDENKVTEIISKHEKYIFVSSSSSVINQAVIKIIKAEIDYLPKQKDSYINPYT